MIKTLAVLACMGALITDIAAAQSDDDETGSLGELALSDDTLQLRYVTGAEAVGLDEGRLAGAFFLSEDRDIVLSAALTLPANLDFGRLTIGLGPQIYAALLEEENNDVMSVSIGAEVRFVLIEDRGLAIAGHAYTAPDILTFGSADNLTDLAARIEYALADKAIVFGGMRWFEFDLTSGLGERTLQEELFAGFGYRF